jgi:hypothetical protein
MNASINSSGVCVAGGWPGSAVGDDSSAAEGDAAGEGVLVGKGIAVGVACSGCDVGVTAIVARIVDGTVVAAGPSGDCSLSVADRQTLVKSIKLHKIHASSGRGR